MHALPPVLCLFFCIALPADHDLVGPAIPLFSVRTVHQASSIRLSLAPSAIVLLLTPQGVQGVLTSTQSGLWAIQQAHTAVRQPSRRTLSGCCASAIEAATLSAMPCQGLRCGMRSLKAMSSRRACMFFTSLLKAGIDLRNAASTDLQTHSSVLDPWPSTKLVGWLKLEKHFLFFFFQGSDLQYQCPVHNLSCMLILPGKFGLTCRHWGMSWRGGVSHSVCWHPSR